MKLFLAYFFVLFCVLSESHEKCVMVKTHAINNFSDVFAIYLFFNLKMSNTIFLERKWRAVILG